MLSSRSTLWVVPSAFTSACRGDAGTADANRAGGEERARSAAEADAAVRKAMADSGSRPGYGRDYGNIRYSPLRQITPANAARLDLAWKYDTRIPNLVNLIN
jgi:glucose dehydrogenase